MPQNGVGSGDSKQLLATLPDPDQRLAQAMATVPTVTGFIFTNHGETRRPAAKAGFAFAGDEPLRRVDNFPAVIADLPLLEGTAAGNGFLNQYIDWDHVVPRVPLVLKLGGKPWPSLAAEAIRLAFGARGYILAGNFDPALFADHIVLVGTSAAGVINDRQATPIAPNVPGVEIHAQLIEQISFGGSFSTAPTGRSAPKSFSHPCAGWG